MAANDGNQAAAKAADQDNPKKKKSGWRWQSREAKRIIPFLNQPLEKPAEYLTWRENEVLYPLVVGPFILFLALWALPLAPSPNPKWTQALISVAGSGDLLIFSAFLAINLASKYRSIEDGRQLPMSVVDGDIRASSIHLRGVVLLVCYMIARIAVEQADLPQPNLMKFLVATISFLILLGTLLWANRLVCKFHIDEAARRLDEHLRTAHYVQR